MINIDKVVKYIEKNGKVEFEKLFKEFEKSYIEELTTDDIEVNIDELKSIFYYSMVIDERIIMIGKNTWDIKAKYSLKEIEDIKKQYVKDVEISDDYKEDLESTEELKIANTEKESTEELKISDNTES